MSCLVRVTLGGDLAVAPAHPECVEKPHFQQKATHRMLLLEIQVFGNSLFCLALDSIRPGRVRLQMYMVYVL